MGFVESGIRIGIRIFVNDIGCIIRLSFDRNSKV